MKSTLAICFAVLTGFASVTALADSGPLLLPVHGIYGLPMKVDGRLVEPLPSHIQMGFLQAIGYDQGVPEATLSLFQQEVRRLFKSSVIDTVTPKNKYRTYSVSIQVTRADLYRVDKQNGTTDIYLPVAVNIFFTNILSGEVLYSGSKTVYRNLEETQANFNSGHSQERIMAAYRDGLNQAISSVLADASNNFKPLQIEAVIETVWNGYLIINKGLDAGIAAGQELSKVSGEGLQILYAGKTYSVGVPTLGHLQRKDVVSFFSTRSASDVKKPRVYIVDADTPVDILGSYASTLFAEELGGKASFSIIPINPDFSQVLSDVASNSGLEQAQVTQSRKLPNYYLRLKLLNPVVYDLASNHKFGKQRVYEDTAFAELLDKSGRVLYSTDVHEEIKDVVIDEGMAFDIHDRYKVLYGNLLKSLTQKLINDVHFSRDELQIQKATPREVTSQDQAGLLSLKQNVLLMHKVGKIDGIDEAVVVPTWTLNVVEMSGGTAILQPDLPTNTSNFPIRADGSDFLAIEGNGKGTPSRLAFSLCNESKDIGAIHLAELRDATYFAIGKAFQQPFFGGDYAVSANHQTLAEETGNMEKFGFKHAEVSLQVKAPYCFIPLLKVTETSRKCTDNETCDLTLNIIAGVQISSVEKVNGPKKLLGVDYNVSNAPVIGLEQFVSRKVLLKTMELMPEAVKQIDLGGL